MKKKIPTNKELLIRIDERQHHLLKKFEEVCEDLDKKLSISEFEEYKKKTDVMWDRWNKALGYLVASALGGGITTKLLEGFVQTIFAAMK